MNDYDDDLQDVLKIDYDLKVKGKNKKDILLFREKEEEQPYFNVTEGI